MSVITRQIWITQRKYIQPIEIVQGSQVGIELQLMDYDIPAGASVKAYAKGKFASTPYGDTCSFSENTISLMPRNGFFIPGPNSLQVEINGIIIPFSIDISCEKRISNTGDDEAPETLEPLLSRLDKAAKEANAATNRANTAESARANAEKSRVSAESARVKAESDRVSAEAKRATAETGRVNAEAARQSASSKAVKNAEKATADCIAATRGATDAASALLNQAGTIALQINAADGGLDILVFKEDT